MEDPYKKLPAALTAAREAAGLTQKELGDRIGKTQQAVAKWENGESNPTRRSMGRLLEVLPDLVQLGLPSLEPAKREFAMDRDRPMPARVPTNTRIEEEVWDALPRDLQRNTQRTHEVDYESPKAVIEICLFPNHPGASMLPHRLWRLSTIRLKNNDSRGYYLLMVRRPGDTASLDYQRQRAIARLTTEASLHGITVLTADHPNNAAEIIHAIESDAGAQDFTTDELFYEDQDPHE